MHENKRLVSRHQVTTDLAKKHLKENRMKGVYRADCSKLLHIIDEITRGRIMDELTHREFLAHVFYLSGSEGIKNPKNWHELTEDQKQKVLNTVDKGFENFKKTNEGK